MIILFRATAPTLPEQILGRELRRMEPFKWDWPEGFLYKWAFIIYYVGV
jgi:hypothetical protein